MRITEFDLMSLIWYPLVIWLGYTGRVDWWVIGVIWLAGVKIKMKF